MHCIRHHEGLLVFRELCLVNYKRICICYGLHLIEESVWEVTHDRGETPTSCRVSYYRDIFKTWILHKLVPDMHRVGLHVLWAGNHLPVFRILVRIHDQHCHVFFFAFCDEGEHRPSFKALLDADADGTGPYPGSDLACALNKDEGALLSILGTWFQEFLTHENIALRPSIFRSQHLSEPFLHHSFLHPTDNEIDYGVIFTLMLLRESFRLVCCLPEGKHMLRIGH